MMSRILARVLGDPGGPATVRPRLPMMFEPGLDLAPGPAPPAPANQGRYGAGNPLIGEPGDGEASDPVLPRRSAMFEPGLGVAHGPGPRAATRATGSLGGYDASLGRYDVGEPGTGRDAHEAGGVAAGALRRPGAWRGELDDPMRSTHAAADPAQAQFGGDAPGVPGADANAAMAGPGGPVRAHPARPPGPQVAAALGWPAAHGGADLVGADGAAPTAVSLAEPAASQAGAAQPFRPNPAPGPGTTSAARERRAAGPAAAEPVVRISIGRVEIRADRPDALRPARPAARPRQPGVELSEYLRRRSGQR